MSHPLDATALAELYVFYPDTGAVTLYSRTYTAGTPGSDAFDAGVSQPQCRKVEANLDQVIALGGAVGEVWSEFHIWNRGQASVPRLGKVIQESDGTRWYIRDVNDALIGQLFVCVCQKEVA